MKFEIIQRCVHRVKVEEGQSFLFISDVHYDSTKCDRKLLKKHLDKAQSENAVVIVNGDWFDLMQGKYDPRGSYSDLRPEYKSITYLDDVINDTVEFLSNYPCVKFIGRGNHETNIEKRLHTSPLDRVAALLPHEVTVAGYAGWIKVMMHQNGNRTSSSWIHYHHGYGGNAPRSKGVLKVDLDQMQFADADVILRGHTHQKWHVPVTVDRISDRGGLYQKTTHHLTTGSYKLLGDRFGGWAVEKGFNTPRLGGWWATVKRQYHKSGVQWDVTEAQ